MSKFILVVLVVLAAWTIEAKAYYWVDIPEQEESRGCD